MTVKTVYVHAATEKQDMGFVDGQCCHVYTRDHLTCYCEPFHVVDQIYVA